MEKLINRKEYLDFLIKLKDKDIIKVVTGIRRCGKSTLFELYKNYLTFCKNYKLNVSTVTTLVQSLQSKNVHVDGDIGSRNFIGIIFK